MNRGRRRGGSGLAGLRDGVKRRLFDPHSVPTKPDAKYEVNRLFPLASPKIKVPSQLDTLRSSNNDNVSFQTDQTLNDLIRHKAAMELAFRTGPFYHPLPALPEGIDVAQSFGTVTTAETATSDAKIPILWSHLLLAHKDIRLWADGDLLKDLDSPDEWFPKELTQFTKRTRKNLSREKNKKKRAQLRAFGLASRDDLNDLVPDQFILDAVATSHVASGDNPLDPSSIGTTVGQQGNVEATEQMPDADSDEAADSDDARWNGEARDLDDEDEMDNDYCQTYFDNGEGDLSDEGAGGGGGDDEDGARFYD